MSQNPLRAFLVGNGVLSDADYLKAEERAAKENWTVMHAIELLGTVPEDKVLDAFSRFYRVPRSSLAEMDIPRAIVDLIPKDMAQKHRVVPIDRAGNNIIVAMGDPRNLDAINAIRFSVGFFP